MSMTAPTRVTIVMYHYVRPLARSRYPAIRGLEVERFREQLAYLRRHYTIIGMDLLLDAIDTGESLPPRACLLTFDDGYSDHYQHVFPILRAEGIGGAFFPPCATLRDRRLLDVNKIHFILAGAPDASRIEAELDRILAEAGGLTPEEIAALKGRCRKADHLDDAATVYIKHLLQYALEEVLRHAVVDRLFATFVSADEAAFAEELYLTEVQAREMIGAGMHFGGHGDHHYWLTRLPYARKAAEISRSREMLLELGMAAHRLTFCYPYGDHDAAAEEVLARQGFRVAVTTRAAVADLATDSALALPRLDTIDLPHARDAAPNEWTLAA